MAKRLTLVNGIPKLVDLPIMTHTSTTLTLDSTHYTILADGSSNTITVTLPAANSAVDRIYNVKKIDSTSNAITVDANGSETIDGELTVNITIQYDSLKIQSDGTNWFII